MRLGALNISCKVVGEEKQPWGNGLAFKYRVKVTHSAFKTASYTTDAWGSTHDYEQGKHDCDGISANIVETLLSANADPDEFISLMMGEATGREALKLGRYAEKIVKAAKKFRYEELQRAVEEAREKNLL